MFLLFSSVSSSSSSSVLFNLLPFSPVFFHLGPPFLIRPLHASATAAAIKDVNSWESSCRSCKQRRGQNFGIRNQPNILYDILYVNYRNVVERERERDVRMFERFVFLSLAVSIVVIQYC